LIVKFFGSSYEGSKIDHVLILRKRDAPHEIVLVAASHSDHEDAIRKE
jgi:hypothetical protein